MFTYCVSHRYRTRFQDSDSSHWHAVNQTSSPLECVLPAIAARLSQLTSIGCSFHAWIWQITSHEQGQLTLSSLHVPQLVCVGIGHHQPTHQFCVGRYGEARFIRCPLCSKFLSLYRPSDQRVAALWWHYRTSSDTNFDTLYDNFPSQPYPEETAPGNNRNIQLDWSR